MYITTVLDLDLIRRLNNVKPSVKSKLFGLSLEELITLPLRKNKKIELFDQKGNPNSKNIQLVNDLIYAKVQDRVSFRNVAYSKIVSEGLGIKLNEEIKHYDQITNEFEFLKKLVDKKNFPNQLYPILKEPIKKKTNKPRYTKSTPKKKRKSKTTEFRDVYKTFIEIQDYFNPNTKSNNSTNLERLHNVLINNKLDVFPSTSKWLYGIKRVKHPNSINKNISKKILELKKEYKTDWNLTKNLQKINLNDIAGMWFVSKERIDIKNENYHNTNLSKLKNYLFDQSALNVDKETYANKYRDPNTDAESIRMYVSPSENFMLNTNLGSSLYCTFTPELGKAEDIIISIHLQGVYAAVKNKFYGRGAHAIYKDKKNRKEKDLFSELSAVEKMKHLENNHRIQYFTKIIELIN